MTSEAVERFFRGVWKLAFVLVVTVAVLFAVGWAIRSVDGDDSPAVTVSTDEER